MALRLLGVLLAMLLVASTPFAMVRAQGQRRLSYGYYQQTCPNAVDIIKKMVGAAIYRDQRMGASLLRLHFHDCFVNGCDASVLLDGGNSEKDAPPNKNSLRGFELIDSIKSSLNDACRGNVVSCADILAVAARDSVAWLGGPVYRLPLGRGDSRRADAAATDALPPPTRDLGVLLDKFQKQKLNLRDLVALSGGHTVGFSKCGVVRSRVESGTNIDRQFADSIRQRCRAPSWIDSVILRFDDSPFTFDNDYFKKLVQRKGLLPSDQALFRGDYSDTDRLVLRYSNDMNAFFRDFSKAMVKMGDIPSPPGIPLEIRRNCRVPN